MILGDNRTFRTNYKLKVGKFEFKKKHEIFANIYTFISPNGNREYYRNNVKPNKKELLKATIFENAIEESGKIFPKLTELIKCPYYYSGQYLGNNQKLLKNEIDLLKSNREKYNSQPSEKDFQERLKQTYDKPKKSLEKISVESVGSVILPSAENIKPKIPFWNKFWMAK